MDRLAFERRLHGQGFRAIAGTDEAGRGPLAGPVVAAAVILPLEWLERGVPAEFRSLNDSKQLTESARNGFHDLLLAVPDLSYGLATLDARQIDALNILRATQRAMRTALEQLNPPPDHVLVDGLAVRDLPWPQLPIVKGDALSYTIAAASVLAKVTRDRIMAQEERAYPGYGFARHKGYGTPEHLAALQTLGPCPIHRRSFAPLKPAQGELFPSK
jgi:ribonuclease HII